MSKINKIFLGLFIVIFLITVGEIVYYFRATSNEKGSIKPEIKSQTVPSPIPSLPIPSSKELAQIARERTITQYVSDLEKGYITSSTLVTFYKGRFLKFENIETDKNEIYNGGMKISIELNIKEKDNINNLVIPTSTVKLMKVYDLNGGVETPITIEDLKEGDSVTVRQESNIVETDPSKGITAFTITKTQ